jgi:hypothetical protein
MDPDSAKSFGSLRIRIHNTDTYISEGAVLFHFLKNNLLHHSYFFHLRTRPFMHSLVKYRYAIFFRLLCHLLLSGKEFQLFTSLLVSFFGHRKRLQQKVACYGLFRIRIYFMLIQMINWMRIRIRNTYGSQYQMLYELFHRKPCQMKSFDRWMLFFLCYQYCPWRSPLPR